MFTGINLYPIDPRRNEETVIQMLVGCHQRIRHFAALARKIAESQTEPPEEISDAAADVHRYFTVAFPLHEADETLSVEPRLRSHVPGTEAVEAAQEMLRQHATINALLRQLIPLWDALCREPEELPSFAPRLLALSSQFEAIWDLHLKLEEEKVFPAINRLAMTEHEEMLAEMRERRRQHENAA